MKYVRHWHKKAYRNDDQRKDYPMIEAGDILVLTTSKCRNAYLVVMDYSHPGCDVCALTRHQCPHYHFGCRPWHYLKKLDTIMEDL